MDELDLSNVKRIAVDETSSRRGHRYVTLFVDVDTKLFAVKRKRCICVIESFKQHLLEKGVQPDAIPRLLLRHVSPLY
ncbi:transposase [Anaerobacillus sp. HL2]|nr:transposase [Anaerobacillus sp. HL2]